MPELPTPDRFPWLPGNGRSFQALRNGLELSVYFGAQNSQWWVTAEIVGESAFDVEDLDVTLEVALPVGYPSAAEAKLAAEALFFRLECWFKRW